MSDSNSSEILVPNGLAAMHVSIHHCILILLTKSGDCVAMRWREITVAVHSRDVHNAM